MPSNVVGHMPRLWFKVTKEALEMRVNIPKAAPSQSGRGRSKTLEVILNGREPDVEAARREAIASATREWIIPALVRRFLAERPSDRGAVGGR
jgi:hypothetical protein